MISTKTKVAVCEIGKPKANDIINAQHSSVNGDIAQLREAASKAEDVVSNLLSPQEIQTLI